MTIEIGGYRIKPGQKKQIDIEISRLPTGSMLHLPVMVFHGTEPGPTVWISGAVHGDELDGVEIVRRVSQKLDAKNLRGTVLALPIVNVMAFLNQSRYTLDRRDLNRSFPGSRRGSSAARLARLFMTEIVARCDVGLDFHTGSDHRANLPHIRIDFSDPETVELARVFGAPAIVSAEPREKSLRKSATEQGAKVLLFEGGQALRFDEQVIEVGVTGSLRVLHAMGMLNNQQLVEPESPLVCSGSKWVRASRGGVARLTAQLGDMVVKGQTIGTLGGPTENRGTKVRANVDGIVIGKLLNPIVSRGDALVHLGIPEIG